MIPTIEQIKPLISKRRQHIIIFVAIIINLFILFIFLLVQFDTSDTATTNCSRKTSLLRKWQKKNQWAELKARASKLGAPIILAAQPIQAHQKQNQVPQKHVINTDIKSHQDTIQKSATPLMQLKSEEKTPKPTPQTKEGKTTIDQVVKATLVKKLVKQTHKKVQTQKQKIKKIKQQQKSTKLLISQKQQKPKFTLAQLVQGFTQHLKHEGEYTLSMAGKKGAKVTEHQLRVGRFLQKILHNIQTSWKINKHRYPLNHRIIATIVIRIVINKDGTLNNLIVQQSSGRKIIDEFVLHILQDASKSFPTIPNYLKQDVCIITCNWEKIPLPNGPTGYIITQ